MVHVYHGALLGLDLWKLFPQSCSRLQSAVACGMKINQGVYRGRPVDVSVQLDLVYIDTHRIGMRSAQQAIDI
jgi:hypothetical protein